MSRQATTLPNGDPILATGTPKTLSEAIGNGLNAGREPYTMANKPCLGTAVESHVRDYMAQKFSSAFLKAVDDSEVDRLQELWLMIVGPRGNRK